MRLATPIWFDRVKTAATTPLPRARGQPPIHRGAASEPLSDGRAEFVTPPRADCERATRQPARAPRRRDRHLDAVAQQIMRRALAEISSTSTGQELPQLPMS